MRHEPPSTSSAVLRFAAGSLLAIAVVLAGTLLVLRGITIDEAERDTRQQVQLEGRLVEAAGLGDGVLSGDPAALAKLDEIALTEVLTGAVVRVKLWTQAGEILYSDEPQLIGQRFELGEEELELFERGGADAELSDLSEPENRFERREGKLLEAHTVVRTPNGTPVLFETYQRFSSVTESGTEILKAIAPALVGGLLVLLLFQVPLALSLTRSLQRGFREREGLLANAVDASDAERRRIASDLHDGVVQDLAGVAFGLAPLAENAERRGAKEDARLLRTAVAQLRQGVRGLRTLLVEIHPPSLGDTGLEPALSDLLSPLAAAGIRTDLRVEDGATSPRSSDALVYRVAREALRNAREHAEPNAVVVRLARTTAGGTHLAVDDDGRGFDAAERARRGEEGHLGLTLLEGLVTQAGGTIAISSTPGAGTHVELEVPA